MEFKYNPDDYSNYIYLAEDLTEYYKAIESYQNDRTVKNKLNAHTLLERLHFTIKHRAIDSGLPRDIAAEMREYIWGLLDD